MDHWMHGVAIAVSLLLRVCTGSFHFLGKSGKMEKLEKEKKIPHSETVRRKLQFPDLIGSLSTELTLKMPVDEEGISGDLSWKR